MQTGPLVLLYHNTHYPFRGSHSGNGSYCGAFSVVSAGAGHTSWDMGAALSFKPFSTHYTLHSGGPGNSDYCGSSVILLRFESSNVHVTYGAAL